MSRELMYMNIETGTVDYISGWEFDYQDREDENQSWEEWTGGVLVEVEWDMFSQSWKEVK